MTERAPPVSPLPSEESWLDFGVTPFGAASSISIKLPAEAAGQKREPEKISQHSSYSGKQKYLCMQIIKYNVKRVQRVKATAMWMVGGAKVRALELFTASRFKC